MADALLAELLQELDLAVIEWLPDQTFRPFAPPPRWFRGMAQWSSLPFLEHFLPEAEAHWRTATVGVLDSHPFVVDSQGEELLLRARALKIEGASSWRSSGWSETRTCGRSSAKRDGRSIDERLTEQARAVQAPVNSRGVRRAAARRVADARTSRDRRAARARQRPPAQSRGRAAAAAPAP
jgi:hypothetical protein